MLELLPAWYLPTVLFIFGTIIGSFLNVYLYRFHTGKSLGGSSHCLSCGKSLRWYELVPIISYLAQWGRCRGCGARVPAHYAAVELFTGLLFLQTFLSFGLSSLLPLYLLLAILIVLTMVYDIRHLIIPDEFVISLICVALFVLGVEYYAGATAVALGWQLLGGVIASAVFGALWLVSRGAWMGLGDVKLVFPLGMLVGYAGVYSFIILSFWIGAAVSVAYLAWQRYGGGQRALAIRAEQLTMKSEVPFAPFLLLSFMAVFYFGVDVFGLLFYAF